MQFVLKLRNLALAVVMFLLAAATFAHTAVFTAAEPGADLAPTGQAEELVQILQGSQTVLWTSLSGNVTSYAVQGWPSRVGDSDLGGGLVIERPEDGSAGVIDFGEKPMSLSFELDG